MECPHCLTDNREDRETCYVCGKDISTLRLVANKARQHYNDALEHAERGRISEAIGELKNALDLDSSLVNAHVVLGTLHAREGRFDEARESWKAALALNPEMERAHDYLERVESVQAALPTIATYRRIALLLLVVLAVVAGIAIYALRPEPGSAALNAANQFIENGQYVRAEAKLEQATILAEPGSEISIAAKSLLHTLNLDLQQRLRLIQDLKYRQLYPEALAAMAELEDAGPDAATSASLTTIRQDISYYYRNMISQLFAGYEQGDLDYATLHSEIDRFTALYPESPERDEILGYLERAEQMEIQTAMDELRRRFALDNNIQTAVEDLHQLSPRFPDSAAFNTARSAFIEEILSSLFNMFTGYLDDEDFVRASTLLGDIESLSNEFRSLVDVDISGAVELAWNVLRDARRQYQIQQIETLIAADELLSAEDALWEVLQEPDISSAEMAVLRSYWRRINRKDRLEELAAIRKDESRFYNLEISEEEASQTLQLYDDLNVETLPRRQRVGLLGVAAAAALRLDDEDLATSISTILRNLDEQSSVTKAVRNLIRERIDTKIDNPPVPPESKVRIEPSRPEN